MAVLILLLLAQAGGLTRLGREDVVALLLEKGADPNIGNNHGASALHTAITGGYQSIADKIRAPDGRDVAPAASR